MGKKERVVEGVVWGIVFLAVVLFVSADSGDFSVQTSSASNGSLNLTLQPGGSSNGQNLTNGSILSKLSSDWNFYFRANLTNASGLVLNNSNANCTIRFNETGLFGSYVQMSFNTSIQTWEYNLSFTRKGNQTFNVNCTSLFGTGGNISGIDNYTILNTPPVINRSQITQMMTSLSCTEDVLCTRNLSLEVTEDDFNDRSFLIFNASDSTTLTNYSLATHGFLMINKTIMLSNQSQELRFTVNDTSGTIDSAIVPVTITFVNDAPTFISLTNQSFNISTIFNYNISATDEENNLAFGFNITFVECNTRSWSTRGSSNCTLFTSNQYSTNATTLNMTFSPTKNDVGYYILNISVNDTGNLTGLRSQLVNFTVLDTNTHPYFSYVCDSERNTSENAAFSCRINASDLGEVNNLTFYSNETWFLNVSNVSVNETTGWNGSVVVSFTASDLYVGNWTINISVNDTGSPRLQNSTRISFNITNVNDPVGFHPLSNITAYTTLNYTLYVNASDDDLLIPYKLAYNENLTFSSNESWVSISPFELVASSNRTQARIVITSHGVGTGNYTVNLTVRDASNTSSSVIFFGVQVLNNTPPAWNSSFNPNRSVTEGTPFILNLSANVSDADGDSITFNYGLANSFPAFTLNLTTGIVNFTANDSDVGFHSVSINASDGKSNSTLTFNFSVSNVNDNPIIGSNITVFNGVVDSNSNINITEGKQIVITLDVYDDDFLIPAAQRSYYNESLSFNLTIQGRNNQLFNFTLLTAPTTGSNRSVYESVFTTNTSDPGVYNITINISDNSSGSAVLRFNLTIANISHGPTLTSIDDKNFSIFETFMHDFNATDTEDGSDGASGSNITFAIINLTAGGNFLTINSTTGVINFTLNQTFAGVWRFNVSVNDSDGSYNYTLFNLTVYDYPYLINPTASHVFNSRENVSYMLNVSANHSVRGRLTYALSYRGLKNETIAIGNATNFSLSFFFNYTDENTCQNFTLYLNMSHEKLSNTTSWNATVNHSSQPLTFVGTIGGEDQAIEAVNTHTVTLSNYFFDADAFDSCYYQKVLFSYSSIAGTATGGAITTTVVDAIGGTTPTITFSASSAGSANFSITGTEYNESNSSQILRTVASNNFSVDLTISTTTTTTTVSGGGGGGGATVPVAVIKPFRLLVQGSITSRLKDKLVIPVVVMNNGTKDFKDILLKASVSKNGVFRKDILATFDNSFITQLGAYQSKNVTLVVDVNTEEPGVYDITLDGSVREPAYHETAKIVLTVDESK